MGSINTHSLAPRLRFTIRQKMFNPKKKVIIIIIIIIIIKIKKIKYKNNNNKSNNNNNSNNIDLKADFFVVFAKLTD